METTTMSTNHALATDPWASTDHDPTSYPQAPIVHPAAHSTRLSLTLARADIHTAVNADDDWATAGQVGASRRPLPRTG